MEEILISASGTSFKSGFKGSNYKLNKIELQRINPISTEEVLNTIPGVNIVGDMGISNRPNISIRGSWGRRSKKVLLLEDGTPAAPAPYIAPGAYYNPVSDRISSIEVYKGADLLRYGPNNMYGAVNYLTALPPQKPEFRVKMIGGQRGYATGLLSYGGTWKNLGALVEGVYKEFGGFTDNSSVSILNMNAKIFAKLSEDQSLYFKISGQSENNQASLTSVTPFTFDLDPTENPFDADQFTMRRYGVDLIHKWVLTKSLSLKTKVYATDFERDWWRQITTKVRVSDARAYLGDEIFMNRHQYLAGTNPGPEDYVIVGRVVNGRESTTDSRWTYTVTGIQENLNLEWNAFGSSHTLEAGFNIHRETFKDRFLVADSTRWARHGRTTKDLWYRLWSANGYLRNEFRFNDLSITPILRFEHVDMYRQDLYALAQDPTVSDTETGRENNSYNQFLPGITAAYGMQRGELYASVYQGMIAPSKVFGFLVERDGVVTNPLAGESINIEPELSINTEIGWRGDLLANKLNLQACYFNNTVRNFYAGGRNEIFEKLGKINIQGLELSFRSEILNSSDLRVSLSGNLTYMKSRVLAGTLNDRDLFSQVIHSDATIDEFIAKVNNNRNAFEIYTGNDNTLYEGEQLTREMFSDINKVLMTYGDSYIDNGESPYTPELCYRIGLDVSYKQLAVGISANITDEQYTEFNNFDNESADGAIGLLPAYYNLDAFINYEFKINRRHTTRVFLNAKNLTNNIYRASRLNRATSGVFPGGFRQINLGVSLNI